ncbi:MAG TPA: DUF2380 domain-containing protein [Methylovirgula sp.]
MRHVFCIFAIAALASWAGRAAADAPAAAPQPITAAIADLDYVDTSGEVTDQTRAHQAQVKHFTEALKHDLAATGNYRFVPLNCKPEPCTSRTDPFELQKAAHAAGARLVFIGGFQKMSTLIQWAKFQIADEDQGKIIFDRLVTYRNDTDEAWSRAETFLVREITAASPVSSRPTPPAIKLAVFGFELKDFSAGGTVIGESPDDANQLQRATDAARRLVEQSGHYSLVDVGHADAAPVKSHLLRDCDGCEAGIAEKLGADQSLLGIVTRISRTEYAVTFRLRDARTGKLISVQQTGLRIGANYSWDRGAAWLIKNHLLEKQGQP